MATTVQAVQIPVTVDFNPPPFKGFVFNNTECNSAIVEPWPEHDETNWVVGFCNHDFPGQARMTLRHSWASVHAARLRLQRHGVVVTSSAGGHFTIPGPQRAYQTVTSASRTTSGTLPSRCSPTYRGSRSATKAASITTPQRSTTTSASCYRCRSPLRSHSSASHSSAWPSSVAAPCASRRQAVSLREHKQRDRGAPRPLRRAPVLAIKG